MNPGELSELAALEMPTELEPCGDMGPRSMVTYCPTPVDGTWVPQVYNSCVHNEADALVKRALGPVPCATSFREFRRFMGRLRSFARKFDEGPWALGDVVSSYRGPLRLRYQRAFESLCFEPLSDRDARLECFVKGEKTQLQADKPMKPRLIFPRSPRYNLQLASFLKPFEHWLWPRLSLVSHGVKRTRNVSKGLGHAGKARLIQRKMGEFCSPVVFEVDGKSFEAHTTVEQLREEQRVYLAAYRGDPKLQSLLAKQLSNSGKTPGGVRFSREGGRASGDFNTGMGNSLVMAGVVGSVMTSLAVKYDSLIDGDNALLFVEEVDLERVVSSFAPLALKFTGHEMVLERPTSVLEEVVYGQSSPVFDGERYVMVRNWLKVLSNATSSYVRMRVYEDVLVFLKGVALCELSIARGLPVLQAYFYKLWSETSRLTARKPRAGGLYATYSHLGVDVDAVLSSQPVVRGVSPASRTSFELAFGVGDDLQRYYEEGFSFNFPKVPPTLPGFLNTEAWETATAAR